MGGRAVAGILSSQCAAACRFACICTQLAFGRKRFCVRERTDHPMRAARSTSHNPPAMPPACRLCATAPLPGHACGRARCRSRSGRVAGGAARRTCDNNRQGRSAATDQRECSAQWCRSCSHHSLPRHRRGACVCVHAACTVIMAAASG